MATATAGGTLWVEEEARSLRCVVHHGAGGSGGGVRVGGLGAGCSGGGTLVSAEDGFEGWHAGAGDGDCELNHGPEVHGDAVAEGVVGFGIDADRVETDDGGDAGESSGSEGQEEGHFFFSRPLDGAEAFEGESEDPEVGDNVEAGGRVEESSPVDTAPLNCFGQVPHLLQRPALSESDDETDEEEHSMEDDSAMTEHAEGPRHGKSKICDENRGFDAKHVHVIKDLDRQSRLEEADHVVGGKFAHRKPDVIRSEDEQHDNITYREDHRRKRKVIIRP